MLRNAPTEISCKIKSSFEFINIYSIFGDLIELWKMHCIKNIPFIKSEPY